MTAEPRRRSARASRPAQTPRRLAFVFRRPGRKLLVAASIFVAGGFLVNALFLQTERHPAPFFNARQNANVPPARVIANTDVLAPLPSVPTPQPRPAEFARVHPSVDPIAALTARESVRPAPRVQQAAVETRPARAAEIAGSPMQLVSAPSSRTSHFDAIGSLITTGRAMTPTPPASIPKVQAGSVNRIFAIQQALAKLGYNVGVDGVAGNETRLAIEAFEKARKLPVTGQMSPRLSRELAARSGVKIP